MPYPRVVLGVLIAELIVAAHPPDSFANPLGLLPRPEAPLATPIAEGEVMFSDVVSFVQRNGWPQDLGRYCETLGLARANPDCRFKQLGAEDNAKPDEGHAINLPANTGDAVPYVLMLLRRPGTVEVFIASPQGDLMAAFHGTAEIGYVRISNDSALPGFTAEVSFWKGTVAKSRRAPESR